MPNVSKSAKLERRHKPEVTLIDYLELICIFRVIMAEGSGTYRQSHRCGAVNDVSDYAPMATGSRKISKGLSLQN